MPLVLLGADAAGGQDGNALNSNLADAETWKPFAEEPWWSLVDMRDVLNVFHPLSVPTAGNAAGATAVLTMPEHWQPPFALRFFCADDYFADPEKHKPGQLGTESFFEHRFKQALIDGAVVWERDVVDENTHGSQTLFQIDITKRVPAGRPFTLTFRVFDKVSTTERDERDVWFIGGTWYTAGDGKTEEEPRFHTAVWFADPVVGEQCAVEAAPQGKRPHEAIVSARHQARWPMAPPSDQLGTSAELKLVTPAAAARLGQCSRCCGHGKRRATASTARPQGSTWTCGIRSSMSSTGAEEPTSSRRTRIGAAFPPGL